jgi:hypothetical protein
MANYLQPSIPAATAYGSIGAKTFAQSGFSVSSLDAYSQGDPRFFNATTFSNTSPTEFGLQANKSIPYHFSCKADDLNKFSPGALMFTIRSHRAFGISCPENSRVVDDLIGINKWLHDLAPRYAHLLKTTMDVMGEIKFMGALKSQITDQLRERNLGTFVMNCVVAQRASVVNVWGNNAREGTPLYIIIKKVKLANRTDMVWRLCPYADMQTPAPPLKQLVYSDGGDVFGVGEAIFIGTAMSTPTAYVEGNENILDSTNASRLACYAGGVDVCIGV